MQFSVLIPVYSKENPVNFFRCLKSIIFDQTRKPEEIILVKDGPISMALESVVNETANTFPIRVISLNSNVGIGKALQEGMKYVQTELTARMDSDDIAYPDRFEKQLKILEAHPEIDVLGGAISEFDGHEGQISGYRTVPTTHSRIVKYSKSRNPMNHMTIMARTKSILAAGNYTPFEGYEDYLLWLKMMKQGFIFNNLSDVLVNVRAGKDLISRRHGFILANREMAFQLMIYKNRLINIFQLFRNLTLRVLPRLITKRMLHLVYKHALRINNY